MVSGKENIDMEEIWSDIPNYEGLYKISNFGRIMNNKGLILKQYIQNSGYYIVHLSNGKRKAFTTHRLVATVFIKNTENKDYVNHIDGNKSNNNIENLEWCTGQENMQHAVKNNLWNSYERSDFHKESLSKRMSKRHKGITKSKEHNQKNRETHKGIAPRCITDRKRKDFIKVLCIETGIEYPTIKDAADSIGVHKDKLWRHLRYGTMYSCITKTFKIIKDGSKGGGRKRTESST